MPRPEVVAGGAAAAVAGLSGVAAAKPAVGRSDLLVDHDALGLAQLVAKREVSPTELLEAAIAKAEALNPRFNFMAQLYGCTPANGVWVVPGSHKLGKIDIKSVVAKAGSERLPDAVPMVCKPGDIVINNRQVVHGSFANTSNTNNLMSP